MRCLSHQLFSVNVVYGCVESRFTENSYISIYYEKFCFRQVLRNQPQYSLASITVRTRIVASGFAGSSEPAFKVRS